MEKPRFYGWKLLAAFWFIYLVNLGFPTYGQSVINALITEIHLDNTFKTELENLVRGGRPEVFVDQIVKDTDDALSAKVKEMTRGLLSISQKVEGGKRATGLEIDKLGG